MKKRVILVLAVAIIVAIIVKVVMSKRGGEETIIEADVEVINT